jgi:GNAT superfamily N-acetyltransferase
MDVKVSLERPDSIEALNLFDETHRELKARYPADSVEHPFDPHDLASPRAVFVIARLDGKPVGCGALRPLDGALGEVKRVFVQPECRRMGIARKIMALLEDQGLRQLGLGFRQRRRAHRGDARSYPPPLDHRQHGRNAKLIFRTEIGFDAELSSLYRRPDHRLREYRKPPVELICVY